MTMTTRVLIVDDEPDVAEMFRLRFRKALRSGAFAFVFATDGFDALEKLREQPDIDIILSDINMPKMDGISLLRELRGGTPDQRIVMISAYGDMKNIRSAMNLGAFDFVTKPIDFDDLRTTIAKTEAEIAGRRRLLAERDAAVLARGNLARYFPPNIVEELSKADAPFAVARAQDVAVLFVDIVGFTEYCAAVTPEQAFDALRTFLHRLSAKVFEFGGTLDKFLGDGLMATFGTPHAGPDDAATAIRCAFAMRQANAEPGAGPAFKVGIGVHWGPVILGNVGSEQRMEFAVIGQTVNIASRLEAAARPLDAEIVVSDTVLTEARRDSAEDFATLRDRGEVALRGNMERIHVWTA